MRPRGVVELGSTQDLAIDQMTMKELTTRGPASDATGEQGRASAGHERHTPTDSAASSSNGHQGAERSSDPSRKNIVAVSSLEQAERRKEGWLLSVIDSVAGWAARPSFIVFHASWFLLWVLANTLRANPFDPYPFSFLTLVVSLEAILLTAFILMAQDRMSREADRRAQIDLQVDLLAEQELTAILQALCLLGERSGVELRSRIPGIEGLLKPTDVRKLADALARDAVQRQSRS